MAILIFWALVTLASLVPVKWSVYLFFISLTFGSFAVLPIAATGGATITPSAVCAMLMITKVILKVHNLSIIVHAMLNWRKLGFLSAFVVFAAFITCTAPILFQGVPVMGLNVSQVTALSLGAGNFTQMAYLVTSYFTCITLYLLLLSEHGRRIFAVAMLWGGTTAVFAGLMDIVTAGTDILSPLRTANYAFLGGSELEGVRRVIGFDVEASAYGSLTIGFGAILLFVQPARLLSPVLRKVEWVLALSLLLMAVLSTSSGTWIGLAVLVPIKIYDICSRLVSQKNRAEQSSAKMEFSVVAVLLLLGIYFTLTRIELAQFAYNLIDTIVLQKGTSSSYLARNSWNTASLLGFYQTGGFGLGVGSTRVSSWPIAILTSTGVIGSLLMVAFIIHIVLGALPKLKGPLRDLAIGARYAFVIFAIPAAGAATLVDFGPFNAIFFALMTAIPVTMRARIQNLGFSYSKHHQMRLQQSFKSAPLDQQVQ